MTDPGTPASPPLGDAARLVADAAQVEARALGHAFVGTEHVLLALLADPELASRAAGMGVPSREELRRRLAAAPPPRGLTGAAGGLSPQARRLLEGAGPLDRIGLLDRIAGSPKGPLAKLLGARPPEEPLKLKQAPAKPAPPAPRERAPAPKPREATRAKPGRPAATMERPARTERPAAPGEESRRPRPAPAPAKSPATGRKTSPPWRLLLLGFTVAAVGANLLHANPLLVFVLACLGVIPLAGYMGEATEHLSTRTGPAVGGLLNATFGNAAELIIAIAALRAGYLDLVKASITGSILGNLLLIMGLCFLAGGLGRTTLRFNRVSAGAGAGMMALAVVGLVFPALFHGIRPQAGFPRELMLTESVALVLAATYLFSLVFSLRTHRALFGGEPHPSTTEIWGPARATLVLGVATAGVVVLSEVLVHATEAVTATMGLSETFLGLIVVPIIGNAAEHGTAVLVARKGQMDLAMQIALGSSTQVALLVAPALVAVGLLIGSPMDLVFSTFEVVALGLTVVITAIITLDGESNWFEGVQLLATYALVGAMAFFV